jgi:hypothetical protein
MSYPSPTQNKIELTVRNAGSATAREIATSLGRPGSAPWRYVYRALCKLERAGRVKRQSYADTQRPDLWSLTAAALEPPKPPKPVEPTAAPVQQAPQRQTRRDRLLQTRDEMGPIFIAFFGRCDDAGTTSTRRSGGADRTPVSAASHGGSVGV